MTFVVTVFTAGNNAAAYCDDVGDQIYHIVSDNKSTVLRNTYNLYDVEADGIVSTTTKYGEIKLHVKEITFRAHLIIDA